MAPKDIVAWAIAGTSAAVVSALGVWSIRQVLSSDFQLNSFIRPSVLEALFIILLAAMVATMVVLLARSPHGTFQFSGMGISFKGIVCPATLWTFVFVCIIAAAFTLVSGLSAQAQRRSKAVTQGQTTVHAITSTNTSMTVPELARRRGTSCHSRKNRTRSVPNGFQHRLCRCPSAKGSFMHEIPLRTPFFGDKDQSSSLP